MINYEKGVAQMSKINNQKYVKLFQTVCEALGGYFVRKHNEEETPLFAENLYKRTFKESS